MKKLLLLPLFALLIVACANNKKAYYWTDFVSATTVEKTSSKIDKVMKMWTGHFSNKEYVEAKNDPTAQEQEIIGRRIWRDRAGEYWLYTAWFKTGSYETPLAHSLAQISRISPDTLLITFWGLDEEHKSKAYEWAKDKPFDDINPKDLENMGSDCGSYVTRLGENEFKMSALGPCADEISDQIKFFEINGSLEPNNINFSTNFLNADKKVFLKLDNVFKRLSQDVIQTKHKNMDLPSS
jgi:hypothetical protein